MPRYPKIKIALAVGGAALLLPALTYAGGTLKTSFLTLVSVALGFTTYITGLLGALFINLGGYLINLGIELNGNLINDSLVRLGFDITLDIVNLLFVLVIIIMALSTVLGFENYGLKKTLPTLIVAALLVNFSLVFAGLIIDFTGVFTKFFISQATNNGAFSLADAITTTMAPQALLNPGLFGQFAEATDFDVALIKILLSGLFTTIFTVVEAIVIMGTAAMIFIRYIHLVLQLIIMPFTWLLLVIPEYSGKFRAWWDSFLQWTLFMPIASFFIYLSIALIAHTDVTSGGSAISASALTAAGTATDPAMALLGTQDLLQTVGKMIAVIGMLTGGLAISHKMGITGASVAIGYADKARGWITGKAGRIAGRPFISGGNAIANTLLQKGGIIEKTAGFLGKTPGLKGVAGGVAARLYNLAASQQASVETVRKEEYSKDSNDAIVSKYNSFTTDQVRKAGLVNEMVKRGLVKDNVKSDETGRIADLKFEEYLAAAKRMGATKEIVENSPTLAAKVADTEKMEKDFPELAELKLAGKTEEYQEKFEEKATAAAMAKFRPGKTETLSPAEIEKVARFFRKEHLERLVKEGDDSQLKSLAKSAITLKAESEAKGETETEHPTYKFAVNNPAAQRIILDPSNAKDLEKLKEDVKKAMEERKSRLRKKSAKSDTSSEKPSAGAPPIVLPPGADIGPRKKEGPPVGFNP